MHKKPAFLPLYDEKGPEKLVVKLPGSHLCNCQASKHKLINNCTSCGRIVCEQEGSGPCYFCGDLVYTPAEQEILNKGGRKSDELRKKLLFKTRSSKTPSDIILSSYNVNVQEKSMSLSSIGSDLHRATAEKNRLLDYQKNSVARTKVLDDQNDYYAAQNSQWLSNNERENLKQQNLAGQERKVRNASKLHQKVTIDLLGRNVIQETDSVDAKADLEMWKNMNLDCNTAQYGGYMPRDQNDRFPIDRPIYCESDQGVKNKEKSDVTITTCEMPMTVSRVQDLSFNEMQDQGCCLSMHQPYASLLIRGIKKFEGRTWYIGHRGILWIASTAKIMPKAEIEEVEQFYKNLYGDNLPAAFPDDYPTGCLLGCVRVEDCLAQEQYREVFPLGESESPYVAVCSFPRELRFKLPISGKQKIYKLDSNIHLAAKRSVEGFKE